MPLLLHMTQVAKWAVPELPWLAEDEIPAYPLFGLNIQAENSMSFWEIDESVRSFADIAAGLAAGRRELKNFDYLLVELNTLNEIGIKVENIADETCCDPELGTLHRELTEISAQKATKLVGAILKQLEEDNTTVDRISEKEVAQNITEGINNQRIIPNRMNKKVLAAVEKKVGTGGSSE